ncbi:MAG: ABC transporter ATP-binding protein, partial [Chloroflexi bacterium]|nr:ABC transporter ATP-binding protein [Chloroflexota bacterium]
LLVLLLVMQVAAIIEGFGISLILPIIQGDEASESRLATIIDWWFDLINVSPTLTNILIVLVIFFVVRAGLLVAQTWYQSRILAKNLTDMRIEFVNALADTQYDFLNRLDSGLISNVMNNELQRVNFALSKLLALAVAITTAAVYFGIAMLIAPVVTVFLVILVLPIAAIMLFLNRMTSTASLQLTDGSNRQQSFLLEVLRNMKYLKATGRTAPVIGRVITEARRVGEAYRKLTFLQGATAFGLEPIIVLVLAVVIYFFTAIRGTNVLEILFLLFVFRTAAVNLVATQPAYRKFISATGSMKVYQDLRSDINAYREPDTSSKPTPDLSAGFEVRNVTYTHPGRNWPAVDKISLKLPAKSTVAFVGPSGSGKSTTANILASLLTPSSGEVLVGGQSYADVNIDQFRQKVGYVTQESVVFNAPIEDNILLWQENADPSDPANLARLTEVIAKTGLDKLQSAQGSDQGLGDGGALLSGGERQRLSIARELYWDSELLILDEATSSMDSLLEKQIDRIIDKQRGTKTIIVIAHRLATVRDADIIFVFEGGRIVESGSFDDLAGADGLFSMMAKLQSF